MEENNVLTLKNIHWKQNGKHIIRDVSWTVDKGENWVLLGLNGSGKTSLLKMITGYQWPTSGEITVLGERFGKTNIQELRTSIGWVSMSLEEKFQHHPASTALEVVLSGKYATIGLYHEFTENDIEKAKQLLHQFRISHLLDEPYMNLSQGEKRKTIIARALMADPKLLILDEPCSGLDILATEEVLQTVEEMNANPNGPTLLYVTHHIEEVVASITHAMLIRSGDVVASGKKHEALTEQTLKETFQLPLSLSWENDRPWIRINSKQIF